MLYLIQPSGELFQYRGTIGEAVVRRDVEKKSLDTLRWKVIGDAVEYDVVLEAALRSGIATGRGLIVDADFVTILGTYDQLLAAEQHREELENQLAGFVPQKPGGPAPGRGYAEYAHELDQVRRNAAHDHRERLLEAKLARDTFLQRPVRAELQQHWDELNRHSLSFG